MSSNSRKNIGGPAHRIVVLSTRLDYLGKPIHISEQRLHILNYLKYLRQIYVEVVGVVGDLVWVIG
jgi:hypothetical protein